MRVPEWEIFGLFSGHGLRVDLPHAADIKRALECVTLVDELIESMLAVGSRLSPHDWSGVVVHACSMIGDVLSIGLHVSLV